MEWPAGVGFRLCGQERLLKTRIWCKLHQHKAQPLEPRAKRNKERAAHTSELLGSLVIDDEDTSLLLTDTSMLTNFVSFFISTLFRNIVIAVNCANQPLLTCLTVGVRNTLPAVS